MLCVIPLGLLTAKAQPPAHREVLAAVPAFLGGQGLLQAWRRRPSVRWYLKLIGHWSPGKGSFKRKYRVPLKGFGVI